MLKTKNHQKVSIIVPYHNSEKYISECIESILGQTHQRIELILVDDHSTDSSMEICRKYAGVDSRIRMIETATVGVSAARNAGIDCASGNYIMFVDSDDWIETESIDNLLDSMNQNIMTMGSYRKTNGSKTLEESIFENIEQSCDAFITDLFNSRKAYVGYCWGKMFDLDLIKKHGIRFNTELAYNEDRLFDLQYSMVADKVMLCKKIVYNYRQHDDSVMYRAEKNAEQLNISIRNEILSADFLRNELGIDYPKATAWLDYNLLKKGYIWRKKLKDSNICGDVKSMIKSIEKGVWRNRDIDLFSRLKLLKTIIFSN